MSVPVVVGLCLFSAILPWVLISLVVSACSAFETKPRVCIFGKQSYVVKGRKAYLILGVNDDFLLVRRKLKTFVFLKKDVDLGCMLEGV